jgi:hypothetical protein
VCWRWSAYGWLLLVVRQAAATRALVLALPAAGGVKGSMSLSAAALAQGTRLELFQSSDPWTLASHETLACHETLTCAWNLVISSRLKQKHELPAVTMLCVLVQGPVCSLLTTGGVAASPSDQQPCCAVTTTQAGMCTV